MTTSTVRALNDDDSDFLAKALALKPWRKGPFQIGSIFIDSEWQSQIKYELLRPHIDIIRGKDVADIGCNNGYYMFRMLEFAPKSLTGYDPSELCLKQFELINSYVKGQISFVQKGIEELAASSFDVIFCLGVLYHRRDPLAALKQLKTALRPKGTLFLDSLYIDSDESIALVPENTYAKMRNVYFVPSILALQNWSKRAGFSSCEVLSTLVTTTDEQRKTAWIDGQSLGDFLASDGRSIEGYEAPKRVYLRLD